MFNVIVIKFDRKLIPLEQLLSMMRIGILEGGVEVPDYIRLPPSQRLHIAHSSDQ
jgi:hypothetical protein